MTNRTLGAIIISLFGIVLLIMFFSMSPKPKRSAYREMAAEITKKTIIIVPPVTEVPTIEDLKPTPELVEFMNKKIEKDLNKNVEALERARMLFKQEEKK